jgi:hypothetical protein
MVSDVDESNSTPGGSKTVFLATAASYLSNGYQRFLAWGKLDEARS